MEMRADRALFLGGTFHGHKVPTFMGDLIMCSTGERYQRRPLDLAGEHLSVYELVKPADPDWRERTQRISDEFHRKWRSR